MGLPFPITEDEPLAPLTTLEIGGTARYFARCSSSELDLPLAFARQRRLPLLVLGGGSNLLVADEGFPGLVVQLDDDTLDISRSDDGIRVAADAGVDWDRLVELAVERGWAGIECLSGIPGRVGAAPMQNIGAYGQEVAETLVEVEVLDRRTGGRRTLTAAECGFSYRDSHFKGKWKGRHLVTRVDFLLRPRDLATIRYPELARFLGARPGGPGPGLEETRRAVLELRRGKSMVLDPQDPNRRSAGSFFLNPIVEPPQVEDVRRRAQARGLDALALPCYPAEAGRSKLSAAWLIEKAGYERGHRAGPVGISSRHALALINHGEATARDLLTLAAAIRQAVREVWGVELQPEPSFVGFNLPPCELLDHLS